MKKKTIKQSLADIEQRLKRIEEQLANKPILDRPFAPMPTETYPKTNPPIPWTGDRPYTGNVICHHCGADTGIASVLSMVIPPEGLACPKCGKTVVRGCTITCENPIPKRPWDNYCRTDCYSTQTIPNPEYKDGWSKQGGTQNT